MGQKRNTRLDWKKQRKIEYLESLSKKYYIFCEGVQTEPNYFNGFKRHIEKNPVYKNLILVEVEGVGDNTTRVIYYAENYVKNYKIKNAQIWCVYDKDSFPPDHFNMVSEYARNLNSKQKNVKYRVAWSNQCVEYWFVLHFNYYHADNDRIYYIQNLNKNFKDIGLPKYEKSKDEYLFEKLTTYGEPKLAIRYAKRRIRECCNKSESDSSPATMIHTLVEELAKYLPEDIKQKYL